MKRWRVVFQLPDRLPVTVIVGGGVGRPGAMTCERTFASCMHEAMSRGGCQGIAVSVHPDSPDCDHDAGGPGGNAA